MLATWLDPTSVVEFTETTLGRAPIARPSAAADVVSVLDWSTLARLLARIGPPDAIVVARGKLLDRPAPRSLAEVDRMLSAGASLVVRRAARYDQGLAALAERFREDLPGEVDLHVFVTPPHTHGFGWHYDTEEVFIVQTAGTKDYYFRANTTLAGLPPDAPPDLRRYPEEQSPIATATLLPGDWLYLPARWWHVALCRETSLSLSVGVRPVSTPLNHSVDSAPGEIGKRPDDPAAIEFETYRSCCSNSNAAPLDRPA